MYDRVKSPHKLMPVYHYGEDPQALRDMLSWRDKDGKRLEYCGISPANDVHQSEKNIYLREVSAFLVLEEKPTKI